MAREEHDPLGHLRQGLEWQAEADQRSAEAAIYARLAELDALSIANRFRGANPPADAIKKFTALLEKLIEAIRANPGHPGHPQSRWEQEALQELQRFAGEAAPAPPHKGDEKAQRPPSPPVGPRMEAREALPASGKARHAMLTGWYQDAHAAGAHNRPAQDAAVNARAERAGATLTWQERTDARRAAKVAGQSGPRPKLKPGS